jgi:hypothetical protein
MLRVFCFLCHQHRVDGLSGVFDVTYPEESENIAQEAVAGKATTPLKRVALSKANSSNRA